MKGKRLAALFAVVLGISLALLWGPTAGRRARALENQAERAIAKGEVQISPAELATLMRNRQIGLAILDLRDEPAFNRFHLLDAKRVENLAGVSALPERDVKVLISDSDDAALDAYRASICMGVKRAYVLAGQIPAWLALFAPPEHPGALLAGALGGRHPASYPDIDHSPLPKFEPKVKLGASGGKKGPGGCGG